MSGRVAAEAEVPPVRRRHVGGGPLDGYYRRGNLDDRQYRAGDRFRSDHLATCRSPTGGDRLSRRPDGRGGGLMAAELQVAARLRWHAAVAALGIRLAPILVAVCCEDRTAADWACRRGRSGEVQGMTTLRLALDVLADHYGF